MNLLAAIGAAITGASMGYCLLSIWSAVRFVSQSRQALAPGALRPPQPGVAAVSILKPLKGADPEIYENFRSHCLQDYPSYEILFGISDANDPAAKLVEKLQCEFPQRAIRLVLCDKNLGVNGKVSSLIQLAAAASHDTLLVNDSDIRVVPDYLRTVIAELQVPDTGLVTCLYRGVPAKSLASRLESLGISTDFAAGVLTAWQIEGGLHFGLGSTLAFRRREVEAIGGFEALVDYLADDYELGKRIADQKLNVTLSKVIVETLLPAYGFSGFWTHQLRWARTIRAARPGGYAGLLLTYTLAWAMLALLLAGGAAWAWILFAAAGFLRIAMAVACGVFAVRDESVVRSLWLLPLRDLIAPLVWLAGIFGRKIMWRGQEFELEKGKLKRTSWVKRQ